MPIRKLIIHSMGCALALLFCLLTVAATRADEATLPTGQRLSGQLTMDRDGHLRFVATKGTTALSLEQLEYVRFPPADLPPSRAAAHHRIALRDGEYFTGEFLSLDEKTLHFRTEWADKVTLPRHTVSSLTHAPGFATFIQDDFETDLKAWKLTGMPKLSDQQHVSGRRSLCLDGPGQSAVYSLATPLPAGRAGINFCDADVDRPAHWLVQAFFGGPAENHDVRVRVARDQVSYRADVSGQVSGKSMLRSSAGWHRLTFEFIGQSLIVTVDNAVLWSSRHAKPLEPLRKIQLACVAADQPDAAQGAVFFDDFSMAKAMPALPRPKGDPSQDELWLLSDDQLFGSIPHADRRNIDVRGRRGSRAISWGEVRGIFFREQPVSPQKPEEGRVRIWLRSGVGFEPDLLEGTMLQLDKNRPVLRHAVLGELAIDRRRLHRLKWLSDGGR